MLHGSESLVAVRVPLSEILYLHGPRDPVHDEGDIRLVEDAPTGPERQVQGLFAFSLVLVTFGAIAVQDRLDEFRVTHRFGSPRWRVQLRGWILLRQAGPIEGRPAVA